MRRVLRHMFAFASVTSLLLCAAVCVVWVRSYFVVDGLIHGRPGRQSGASSVQGRFLFDTMGDSNVPRWPGFSGWERTREQAGDTPLFLDLPTISSRGMFGFRHTRMTVQMGQGIMRELAAVTVPHWSVAVVLLALPAVWFAAFHRRRHRRRHSLCAACGYDLRASPERCPECGAAATAAAAAARTGRGLGG